jgi:hypothetical protein
VLCSKLAAGAMRSRDRQRAPFDIIDVIDDAAVSKVHSSCWIRLLYWQPSATGMQKSDLISQQWLKNNAEIR